MERVINIIGMGASAATRPDTGEMWGLCNAYKYGRMDKLFFMDNILEWTAKNDPVVEPVNYTFIDFAKDCPDCEIISRFNDAILDTSGNVIAKIKGYPLKEAAKLAPGSYFTSTIAYAICYAILEKVDRIRLYGFEIWSGSDANEYEYQRPCVDFWLAFALGRGVKVEVPYYLIQTANNRQNLYGYFQGELKQNIAR